MAAVSSWAGASKKDQAKQLYEAAKAATDLRQQPYQLHAHLRLQMQTMVEGDLIAAWNPPDQRRIEISLPGYTEIHVLNGTQEWVTRPAAVTPLSIIRALTILKLARGLAFFASAKAKNIKDVVRAGQELTCITEESKAYSNEVCFDTHRHVPLTTEVRRGSTVWVTQYGDYQALGEKFLPRFMSKTENGVLGEEVRANELTAGPAPAQAFAPLPGVQPVPACAEPMHPTPTHMPDPSYTSDARNRRIQGTVVLGVIIASDGRVGEVSAVQSLDPGLDQQAINAVKTWQFKPAMCDSTPVLSEISVEMHFRLE